MKKLFHGVVFLTCWHTMAKTLYLHTGEKGDLVTIFMGNLHGFTNIGTYKFILLITFFFHILTLLKWRFLSFPTFLLWLISCSIHLENVTGFDHNLILPTQFLYLSFLSLYAWKEKMPLWIYHLQLFFLSLHYFGAGATKLYESGLSWVDGTTLQMSLFAWSDPQSFFSHLLIKNHMLAKGAQATILGLELIAPLILFKLTHFNRALGMILVIFHFVNEALFQYGFWPSLIFVTLSLIIFDKNQATKSPSPA